MAQPIRSPRRAAAGFTLLELMVALTLGGIAITSIYAVGAASTRTFHQQQQVASAQSSLRVALGELKRDIARAGFLATPNAAAGMSCATPTSPLHEPVGSGALAAVSRYAADFCVVSGNNCANVAGGDPTSISHNRASGFVADELVLFGNYETASEYGGLSLMNAGSTISVGSSWHSYQTDFTKWHAGTSDFDDVAFGTVFANKRLIRIRTTKGLHHFAIVTGQSGPVNAGSTPLDATVTFAPAVPATCAGDIDGGWVAPVNAIRYFARDQPNPPAANADTFGPMAQLVRQEVDPQDKINPFRPDGNTPAAPPRIVLDYLVAFRLAFVLNGAAAPNAADAYAAGVPAGNVSTTPEALRAVRIELAARTPEQDNKFPWSAGGCGNLRCFQVFSNRPGAARVRTVRAEVFVPNVAFEGY